MSPFAASFLAVLTVVVGPTQSDAKGFLKSSLRAAVNASSIERGIQTAMGEALGCGGHVRPQQLAEIEKALSPIWRTLPKNSNGRIERRSLRYLAHRYFMLTSSVLVRGFEPTRPVNQSSWGREDILSQRVPAYVESRLESQHAEVHGFDLHDAVQMVATLEQLIYDSEGRIMTEAYENQAKPIGESLEAEGVYEILEEFMVRWLLSDDADNVGSLLRRKDLREEHLPSWPEVKGFVRGQVQALAYRRQQSPREFSRPGHNALAPKYSFEDTHEIVGTITKKFASFWQDACTEMKAGLVKMDPLNTGRVPLSKFYGSALDSEWRYGESEGYLRDLGALDETSSLKGPQVIIPNYIQGASNCIIGADHYLVCCQNECESMLGEIESAIGAPVALPGEILALVGNMTSQTTVDHDDPPKLQGALTAQLEQIAAGHSGKVPLHGRLFAQWLHYAFPHECAFPHKTGSNTTVSPSQFSGGNYLASKAEMRQHVESTSENPEEPQEALEWMSQWSEEEELLAEYTELQASSVIHRLLVVGGTLVLLAAVVAGATSLGRTKCSPEHCLLPMHGKSHFV